MRPTLYLSKATAEREAFKAIRAGRGKAFKTYPETQREPDGSVSAGHVVFLLNGAGNVVSAL